MHERGRAHAARRVARRVGRRRDDAERLERSGLLEFEAELARFLTVERGRATLLGPLQMARGALAELRDRVLPERAAMLRAPVDGLMAQLDELGPRLEGVRQRRRALGGVGVRRRHESRGRVEHVECCACVEA